MSNIDATPTIVVDKTEDGLYRITSYSSDGVRFSSFTVPVDFDNGEVLTIRLEKARDDMPQV